MIEEGATFAALDEGMREALTYLGIRLFFTGWSFGLLLFSGFCVLLGLLILRSWLAGVPPTPVSGRRSCGGRRWVPG